MKKILMSALVLTVSLGSGAAIARGMGEAGPRTLPSFEQLDRDGNGQVTPEEIRAFGEARRAEMEAKRDDRMQEHAALMGDRTSRMFDRVDANDDGVVDAEEYAAFTDRMAERMEKRGKRGWGHH